METLPPDIITEPDPQVLEAPVCMVQAPLGAAIAA
jgi:hypothetical protein